MLGKGDNRAIREVNRSIILDLVRRGGRISRTELARRSRLTKPTVSAIVGELMTDGVVREVGFGVSGSGGGRPARLLEFNDAAAAYLGIHFGVRATTVAVADAQGTIRLVRGTASFVAAPERTLSTLGPMVAELLEAANVPRSRVEAAGATVPGLIDQESGVCVLAPNLRWRDVRLREALTEALGVPVSVHNITQAAAVAEGRVGAARGARSYVWVYVGSGVGSGVVDDGRLFVGRHGFSGEIGHCPVVEGGPLCACGRRGCLETVASAMALARAAEAAIESGEPTLLASALAPLDAAAITRAAREGDAVSLRILAQAGEHLGRGISYLLNVLNPEMVVLGGPVAEAGELLLEGVRKAVAEHALVSSGVAIVASRLGDRAELTGAVLLAMDQTQGSYRIVGPTPPTPHAAPWDD
jgi:predicted NBD/HSP70 family sugar kinase